MFKGGFKYCFLLLLRIFKAFHAPLESALLHKLFWLFLPKKWSDTLYYKFINLLTQTNIYNYTCCPIRSVYSKTPAQNAVRFPEHKWMRQDQWVPGICCLTPAPLPTFYLNSTRPCMHRILTSYTAHFLASHGPLYSSEKSK